MNIADSLGDNQPDVTGRDQLPSGVGLPVKEDSLLLLIGSLVLNIRHCGLWF